jgi:diguanylate cyclase (GGDEF)-like protein/putative nucleotidyltransferase with HDIG domain
VLVVVWERAPVLTAALVGPLLAIALYQRSTYRALRAMRLALTDPLTGLGNHRHFHERLAKELADAERWRLSLSLCLVDIDGFKQINDRFGHPAGDRVLAQLASKLRTGGEAFRLGGDEFALLLPGFDERAAMAAARAIVERIGAEELDPAGRVTVSAGIATFPIHTGDREELIRLADGGLYWAKEYGKNQARAYRPDVIELAELKRIARGPDRAARLRAAASLARAVDARDTYTGRHSERVARLAASVATRMGLAADEVELTRLAGSLHDLGKLAIPEEILRKPGPLTDPERMVLERHPQIGFRMLESLGIDPVSAWVLHHHERWDGTGYPDGLPGEAIPLGARIIFVADAFDAMTSERVYRDRLDASEALAELSRCAGTQFDPEVVAAFAEELGVGLEAAELLAPAS